jgi:hypothetical protein
MSLLHIYLAFILLIHFISLAIGADFGISDMICRPSRAPFNHKRFVIKMFELRYQPFTRKGYLYSFLAYVTNVCIYVLIKQSLNPVEILFILTYGITCSLVRFENGIYLTTPQYAMNPDWMLPLLIVLV